MDRKIVRPIFLEERDIRDAAPVKHERKSESEKPGVPRTITFSIDDWCKGSSRIMISRRRLRRIVTAEKGNYLLFRIDEAIRQFISRDEFDEFVSFLFEQCGIESWEPEYRNPDLLDGINWHIRITFDHGPDLVRRGSNAFPPCWQEVCTAFMKLALKK